MSGLVEVNYYEDSPKINGGKGYHGSQHQTNAGGQGAPMLKACEKPAIQFNTSDLLSPFYVLHMYQLT